MRLSISSSALLAALDAWFDRDGPPFALVLGAPGAGKTSRMERWALHVAERGTVEVSFLPVDRRLGTALERNALRRLAASFPDPEEAITLPTLRGDVRHELWSDRDRDQPVRLVVVAGIDRAEGWSLPSDRRRYPDPGERVRVVVSADMPRDGADRETIDALCRQQGWIPGETEVFILSKTPAETRAIDGCREDEILHGALALLTAAFRPLDLQDLSVFLQEPASAVLARLDAGWSDLSHLIEREDEITRYRFRHEVLRREWQVAESSAVDAWERRIVAAGLAAVAAVAEGRCSPEDVTPYLVDNLGAHLTHLGASLDDLMSLVGPAWLRIWSTREDAVSGFLADVRRARDRAEDDLRAQVASTLEAEAERARLLIAIVRCAIVEGSLYSAHCASTQAKEPRAPLDVERKLDWRLPRGADVQRMQALVVLASSAGSPGRDEVLELAYGIAQREPACLRDGSSLVELAAALTGRRREQLAHEAVRAIHADLEVDADVDVDGIGRALLVAAALLPIEEGRALVDEAVQLKVVNKSFPSSPIEPNVGVLAHAAALLPDVLLLEMARASACLRPRDRRFLLGKILLLLSPAQRSGVASDLEREYLDHLAKIDPTTTIDPEDVVGLAALGKLLPGSPIKALLADTVARMNRETEHRGNACALLRIASSLEGVEKEAILADARERLLHDEESFYVIDSCPVEVCGLLGPEGAIALLERDARHDHDSEKIESAAQLATALPLGLREAVVARMTEAQAERGDDETLRWVFQSVQWMTMPDRIRLFCAPSSRDLSLYSVLHAHGGYLPSQGGWLPRRAELLCLLGGQAAVLGAAREIVEVATWLP